MILLPVFAVRAGSLLHHVSRTAYRGQPLHFGRTAVNRYDAPECDYGVLYLGQDLATALMESVFHEHRWSSVAKRTIALAEIHSRLVRLVGVRQGIVLADVTAPRVMAGHFGLNLEQLASRDYGCTRRISAQVHALQDRDGGPRFDGILYPSRNNYPAASIALFEHAGHKVGVVRDLDLADHVGWPSFVADYGIGVVPATDADDALPL